MPSAQRAAWLTAALTWSCADPVAPVYGFDCPRDRIIQVIDHKLFSHEIYRARLTWCEGNGWRSTYDADGALASLIRDTSLRLPAP